MPLTPEEINDQRLRAYAEEVLAWKHRYDAECAAHQETQARLCNLKQEYSRQAMQFQSAKAMAEKAQRDLAETQAIARELLSALEHCYAPDHDWIDKKRAAVAKAKGVLPAAESTK